VKVTFVFSKSLESRWVWSFINLWI